MTSLEAHPATIVGRAVRGSVFTALSAAIALAAHRLGGGTVTAENASALLIVLALAGWAATRRERSRWFVLALVLGTQTAAHIALGMSAMLRPGASSGGRSDLGVGLIFFCHHGASHITAVQQQAATRGLVAPHVSALTPPPSIGAIAGSAAPMLLAHLGAAVVLAWWLHRGERAAWRGVRRAVLRLTGTSAPRPAPIAFRPRTRPAALAPFCAHEHAVSVSRRGPPNPSCVSLILGRTVRLDMV